MKKILLIPCMFVSISVLCQTNPKLKTADTIQVSKKIIKPLSAQVSTKTKTITQNKEHTFKKSVALLKGNKQTDHSFDPLPEPE